LGGSSNPATQSLTRPSFPHMPSSQQRSTSEENQQAATRKPELGRVKRCSDGWYLARTPCGKTLMWEFATKEDAKEALKEWKADHQYETMWKTKQATSVNEEYGTSIQSPKVSIQSHPDDASKNLQNEKSLRPCSHLIAVSSKPPQKKSIREQEPANSCPTGNSSSAHPRNSKHPSGRYQTQSYQPQSHIHRPGLPSHHRPEASYSYQDQKPYLDASEPNYRNYPEYNHTQRSYYPQYPRSQQQNYWSSERPSVRPRKPDYESYNNSQYDSRCRRYWQHQDVQNPQRWSQDYYRQPVHGSGSHRSSRDFSNVVTNSRLKEDLPPVATDFLETEIAPAAEECNAYEATTDVSSPDKEGWVQNRRGSAAGSPHHPDGKRIANQSPGCHRPGSSDREARRRQHKVPSNVYQLPDTSWHEHKDRNQRITGSCEVKDWSRNGWRENYAEHEANLPQHYRRTPAQQRRRNASNKQSQSSWSKEQWQE
jgi:hypothetical protein